MSSDLDRRVEMLIQSANQRISIHCSKLMKLLDKKLVQYNPSTQINLKKQLLTNLPEKPMKLSIYMDMVYLYIKNYEVLLRPLEWEAFLESAGFIRGEYVCKSYAPEGLHDLLLKIL